jgi:hypothetical protein
MLAGIDELIKATHRLSFYSFSLHRGVAFRPVAVRVQKEPLNLVTAVLDQDRKAYTKLDDLLEIGRSLVKSYLPNRERIEEDVEPLETRLFDAEYTITGSAIEAALRAKDFDTAYAYITTRLSRSPSEGYVDDTSWRAAYAAGKYRPSSSPQNLSSRIDSLSQRMELLSRALMLAPAGDSLAEILGTWRRYEEEMDSLRAQAVAEERAFDVTADASLPGAFGLNERELDAVESKQAMARRTFNGSGPGVSYEDYAPMGLFDVAKGAASAFRKSSFFPLGATGLGDIKIRETSNIQSTRGEDEIQYAPNSPTGGRVRKRDMVSNMVTSGLVNGMGWVLGAQPQDRIDLSGDE